MSDYPVLPGIRYGIRGEFIPNCRSVFTLFAMLSDINNDLATVKDFTLLDENDKCQRGPNGKPLTRLTPAVPFQTYSEWESI